MLRIDELKMRYEQATNGDWGLKSTEPGTVWILDDGGAPYARLADCRPGGMDNAMLIATMHRDLPRLIDLAEKVNDWFESEGFNHILPEFFSAGAPGEKYRRIRDALDKLKK